MSLQESLGVFLDLRFECGSTDMAASGYTHQQLRGWKSDWKTGELNSRRLIHRSSILVG